jgi:tRNA dimethylallyltransferase
MFEAGLVNEVKKLIKSGLSKTSCTALGIKEVKGSLEGLYNLEEAKRLLKLNTRHYAKRQLTWFRKDKRIRWLEIKPGEKPSLVADKIMSEL